MNKKTTDRAKKYAAETAVKNNVRKNMVIGIGSGSTIVHAVKAINNLDDEIKSSLSCIPTSYQSKQLIIQYGLNLCNLDQFYSLDIAIDGADEIDNDLNLIKGGGACLVQEKIVATSSRSFIVIADWRKISSNLGDKWRNGIPIEIIPEANMPLREKLRNLGGNPVLRNAKAKMGPLVTDNGNFIIDVDFGKITNPLELHDQLKSLTGVVDSGLFVKLTTKAYIGQTDGTVQTLIP